MEAVVHWGLVLYKDLLKNQPSAASSAVDRKVIQPPLPPSKDLQSARRVGQECDDPSHHRKEIILRERERAWRVQKRGGGGGVGPGYVTVQTPIFYSPTPNSTTMENNCSQMLLHSRGYFK